MKPIDVEEEQRIAAALGLPIRPAEPRRVVEMTPEAAPPVARKRPKKRGPIYLADGTRLGKAALWT